MKKKNLAVKVHNVRENTPDLSSTKQKTMKSRRAVAPITPSSSTTNIKKKINAPKNPIKNSINIYTSTADIHANNKNFLINKSKFQKKNDLNKTVIEPKKEIKKENKAINPNGVQQEIRSKSAAKRPIKKNKDKDKSKKEEIKKDIQLPKKNINIKENNRIKKETKEFQRRKSFDMLLENNKIKQKEKPENNYVNNKNMDISIKKRRQEIAAQKTPNKIKNINYNKGKENEKDIMPLKTGKSGDRNELKFNMNRNKKQIMNRTPDAGRMRNRKNSGGQENIPPKKQKYGNVDIKSIITKSDNNNKEERETKIIEKEIKEVKSIKYRKIRNKTYNNNFIECLYLSLNSGFFIPNKKLNIILNSKELYKNINKKQLIEELINYYNKIGDVNSISNSNNKNKYDIKKINEPFKPNERCINALNFIDKNEEQKLINEIQHPYIIELFNAVIILLNEYKNIDEKRNVFEFFFNDILKKYNVKNMKKLMVKNFVNERLIINDDQFELIQKKLIVKPDLFSPSTLLRYNRAVAYFSFFVKELFSYLNLKTNDGKYYYKIRASLPKNKYQERINNLKLMI